MNNTDTFFAICNIKENPCNTKYGLQGLLYLNNVDLQFILYKD